MAGTSQVIEAAGIDASGDFGLNEPDTDYMPGGDDAHILASDIGETEPKVLVLGSDDGHTWPAVKTRILQAEAQAIAAHYHKRIVKVSAPDIPGRPDFEHGVYSGFPVHHGEAVVLHFNDGSTHELD